MTSITSVMATRISFSTMASGEYSPGKTRRETLAITEQVAWPTTHDCSSMDEHTRTLLGISVQNASLMEVASLKQHKLDHLKAPSWRRSSFTNVEVGTAEGDECPIISVIAKEHINRALNPEENQKRLTNVEDSLSSTKRVSDHWSAQCHPP